MAAGRACVLLAATLSVAACGSAPEVASPATAPGPAAPAAATPAASAAATPASTSVAPDTGHRANVQITFYAAYDNDPKGSTAIDNPVIHKQAGGVGSFSDPLTFASATGAGEYPAGTKIYVPLVQKYFIREDSCEVSWTAPNGCGSVTHVDLYVGNPSATKAVLKCEDALTPDGEAPIVLDPAPMLPYDPTPIWNQATSTCMSAH